jgi:hypothetical protein
MIALIYWLMLDPHIETSVHRETHEGRVYKDKSCRLVIGGVEFARWQKRSVGYWENGDWIFQDRSELTGPQITETLRVLGLADPAVPAIPAYEAKIGLYGRLEFLW